MAKITIINVDLGVDINSIISEDIQALTGESRAKLDEAIDAAKAVERVKAERTQAAQAATDKVTNVIMEAYDKIMAAGDVGLPVSSVMAIVVGIIPNSSAFTLRMKNILFSKGNLYVLERVKHHGTPHYRLMPYNAAPEPTP